MRNMGAQQLARQIHEASISGPPSIAAYYLWQYRRRKLAPEASIIVSSRVKHVLVVSDELSSLKGCEMASHTYRRCMNPEGGEGKPGNEDS